MNDKIEMNLNEDTDENLAIGRLIELGKKKTFLTINDILTFFPNAEQDVDQLEEAFAALISAGIQYIDDTSIDEPSDDELSEEEEESEEPRTDDGNILANVDIEDTIGLYLKEVGRVALLTAEEEVELAQRIERGRLAREEMARGNVKERRRRELQLFIQDGWAAREHLITANSRLVISVAKKYMGRKVYGTRCSVPRSDPGGKYWFNPGCKKI
jgi:RNA polymerase primary sigma factor